MNNNNPYRHIPSAVCSQPIIYNLLPRLTPLGKANKELVGSICELNCTHVHLAPVIKTGNRSSYAPAYTKNGFELDPLCFDDPDRMEEILKEFICLCLENGIIPIYDLVIGHAYYNAPITRECPEFFSYDKNGKRICQFCFATDPNYETSLKFEDIARFNYEGKPKGLYEYAYSVVKYFLDLGFGGFRVDMAVHIPADLWKYLISRTHEEYGKDIIFIGESFGCPWEKIIELADAGYDYYYNSSFWWDGTEDWLPEQVNICGYHDIRSISILGNHDTERIIKHWENADKVVSRIRLNSLLTSGVSITQGDEYGVTKKYDVFTASPE
ncbi:MAG: hypothetical protein IKU19_06375, partial [Clostridia bacterium]|nr:hypothetical protein [Clostridia bacterium]